jgi:hypothetical protein
VWLEVGSHGEVRFGVKVYDENVGAAYSKATDIFSSLARFASDKAEEMRKSDLERRISGLGRR